MTFGCRKDEDIQNSEVNRLLVFLVGLLGPSPELLHSEQLLDLCVLWVLLVAHSHDPECSSTNDLLAFAIFLEKSEVLGCTSARLGTRGRSLALDLVNPI